MAEPVVKGKVYVVGVGPGNSEYLTLKAVKAVNEAHLVAGFNHSLRTIGPYLRGKSVKILTMRNQEEVLAALVKEVEAGKICCITCTGDPNFSDAEFIERIQGLFGSVEVIPGISSIQVAASRSLLPLDDAELITFHVSGDIEGKKGLLLEALRRNRPVLLLPRPWDFMPDKISEYLLSRGISPQTPVLVYENLTLGDERTFKGRVGELKERTFSDLSIVIIGWKLHIDEVTEPSSALRGKT